MSLAETLAAVTTFFTENPEVAQDAPRAHGELVGPFEVLVTAGAHQLTVDEPVTVGGGEAGPSPIETALVALASCQAITYRLWATKLGIALVSVGVAVEADYDARGLLGVDGYHRPGLDDVRVTVTLEGPDAATSQQLRAAVDQHCPVLDLFRAGVPVTTSLAD
jgi:putative redox protein